jgi:hypothetical protein
MGILFRKWPPWVSLSSFYKRNRNHRKVVATHNFLRSFNGNFNWWERSTISVSVVGACSLFTLQPSHISTIFYPIGRCIFVRMTRTIIVGLYQLNIIFIFGSSDSTKWQFKGKTRHTMFHEEFSKLYRSGSCMDACWMALRVAQYDCHLNVWTHCKCWYSVLKKLPGRV